MGTKGVLILGLIVCWTAVCNAEDGFLYDYGTGDITSKELAEDYLLRAPGKDCSGDNECENTEKCEGAEGSKKCKCAPGLTGDNCEKNEWCEGKFKNCKSDNGTCKYDEEERSVVCTCAGERKLHPKENRCRETCTAENDCKNEGKCEGEEEMKFCTCGPGLSGDKCQTVVACLPTGKYKDCEESGGKCKYVDKKAVCECSGNKKLNNKNVCKETCTAESDCKNEGKCEGEGNKFCTCGPGLSGDKCETVVACLPNGIYKDCEKSGGECKYANNKPVCECSGNKKLDNKNMCKEPCTAENKCKNEGECKGDGEIKFCTCGPGLSGDLCQTVDDCSSTGKYKDCEESGGKCKYLDNKAVCECSGNKKFHDIENVCKDSCDEDKDCKDNQKCKAKEDGWKTCQCADGLTGPACEKKDWCEEGKFKNCKTENGTCDYNKDKRIVECTCDGGRKLHPNENRCRETCIEENECKNEGKCKVAEGGNKFCTCGPGLSGDKCQTVVDCSSTGKYKGCEESGGKCKYVNNKAVCECPEKNKLDDKENVCKECDCGPKGTCKFENSEKKCDCQTGYVVKDGKCTATCTDINDCKNGGTCDDQDGNKFCTCGPGLEGDKCEIVSDCTTGKYKGCVKSGGNCKYDTDKAVCECPEKKKLDNSENVCKDTCNEDKECKDVQKCAETDEGWKTCKCADGRSGDNCEKNDWCLGGKFKDCKGGVNGTCEYDKAKRSVVCTCSAEGRKLHPNENRCRETCAEDKECKNGGKCEESDGNKFCTCGLGLIGDKCQTVLDCTTGKYKGCESSGGKCKYDSDKTVCECPEKKKLDDKTNVCRDCDCGPKGTCKFVNSAKNCDCEPGYAVKNGKCTETCSQGECEYESECKSSGDVGFCVCQKGLSGDKCSTVDACGANGKFKNCKSDKGTCEYDVTKKAAFCDCHGGKELNSHLNYCQDPCDGDDDCKGGKCTEQGGKKFCKCLNGLEGDRCEDVTDCVSGKYSKCEESGGSCGFDEGKSTCKCPDEKRLDERPKKHICRKACAKDDECHNSGKCNPKTKLCECKPNTSGDLCETIDGCDPLKCDKIDAKCVYDDQKLAATCKCNDNKYYYEAGKCNPEWCKDGCNTAVSICKYSSGVGFCECKNKASYYDYSSRSCKKIDVCLNKTCDGDLICNNKGACVCPDDHKKNNVTCEPIDLCKANKCFPDAKCEAGNPGYVKCLCNSESKYYLGSTGKCEDGSCFLAADRKNCKSSCPSGMNRVEGECKHQKEERNCDKDCGFRGWCYKVSETEQKCFCDPNYAELDKKKEKCVLKISAVCPLKERAEDNKCKCTGKYKQAKDGITCELRSCSDQDVKDECKRKRAPKCVENWKNAVGYKCVCPEGYIDDKDKGCIDPCSIDKMKNACLSKGEVCYIGSNLNAGDCRCPPGFTKNENTKSCELGSKNAFIIHNFAILSKKYETVDGNFNQVLLNIDVTTAMKQVYTNLDFVHVLNPKLDNGVLFCEVWLQFNPNPPAKFNATSEVQRWLYQIEALNQVTLPPGLLLSENHFASAEEEQLTLCSTSVQPSVCGKGSTCVNDTCSCGNGFREIDSTIKASGNKRVVRCEDIDECAEKTHVCKDNSKCVNTPGDYLCVCNPGFKKEKGDDLSKEACIGLCDTKPCGKGSCQLTKENNIECTCPKGTTGSFCNKEDVNLAKAGKATKVVGAVLGTILAIVIVLIIVYIVRQRQNSYSEDFTPAPRVDNAEMIERRPMRGVTNRAYQ